MGIQVRGRRSGPARIRLAMVFAALAVVTLSGQASASIYAVDRYSGSDAWEYDDCGFAVDVASTFGGNFHVREGKGADAGAFFVHNAYWWREVHVRRSDGRTLILSAKAVFQETRATRVEGSVFEFSSVNAGQPFVVTDANGTVLSRDRGSIRETILFDTLGDATPGGNFITSVDFQVSGPHPGLDLDICPLF